MKTAAGILLRIRTLRNGMLVLALLGLSGCMGVAIKRTGEALAPLPPLITQGATHYTIQSRLSDIRFLVYRAGPLAVFGHNHVIRANGVHGDVYLNHDFTLSGFAFSLPVVQLQVDEPADRAAEGADFAAQPSAAAIAGTLHNVLGPAVLDAARYPDIRVRSVRISGSPQAAEMTVRITLHGVERDVSVPVVLRKSGKLVSATGRFDIRQSDFGITPFSILGGGLRVADVVKVHFKIVAEQ